MDGLARCDQAQEWYGGWPAAKKDDTLAVAQRQAVSRRVGKAKDRHLKIGRLTLYRALQPREKDLAPAGGEVGPVTGRSHAGSI